MVSESEDESNTIDLLERVSDSILMEDKLDALNQLRDCMRESRPSHALLAKVGGIDVIFDCLLEEQIMTREREKKKRRRAKPGARGVGGVGRRCDDGARRRLEDIERKRYFGGEGER